MVRGSATTTRPRHVSASKSERATTAAPSVSTQYSSDRATGWVSHLPPSWVPYVQLARLTLPAALMLIYLPTLFGVLLAAVLGEVHHHPSHSPGYTCFVLLVASFFFSNAAHVWDDLVDAPIDALVARTARRPIPRGAVSRPAALAFGVANALGAAATLAWGFPDPALAFRYAAPNILATTYYPFAKRHTNLPQLVLGFCLAWGVVMGAVAVGCEPYYYSHHHHTTASSTTTTTITTATLIPALLTLGPLTMRTPFLALHAACTLWSAIYDTIYAAEDYDHDVALGVGSLVVLCGGPRGPHTKRVLYLLLACLGGCLVVCGLSTTRTGKVGMETGVGMGMSWWYYAVAPVGATAALGAMIRDVDLEDPKSTWWWFRYGYWFVAGSIVVGLAGEVALVRGWGV
ncbi:UbiA prenyltransferase family-domain-containing protein [Chaetomium strumarium]|uniref:UbiA prenyltransferase family-domain-containing protein n=1 Tax=Chaetomium strumarium TaxID=1170767 RepID=A0AAJ0GN49_9PEZI|nr:UbiA prenyltransferase family-domain-containing protein [Chaetomium strumarium]